MVSQGFYQRANLCYSKDKLNGLTRGLLFVLSIINRTITTIAMIEVDEKFNDIAQK
jgi:hypothetical protein